MHTARPPFAAGERLTYHLNWGVLAVGTAVMEVHNDPAKNDRPMLKFLHTAQSNAALSAFYQIDDHLQSTVEMETLLPSRLIFQRHEGAKHDDIVVQFDQRAHTAILTKNEQTEIHEVPAHVQDTLSWLYFIRALPQLTPGVSVEVPVFHDGKTNLVAVQVVGIERTTVPVGELETVHVRAQMPARGLFSNKGPIEIWLTNDTARVPVLIKTKVAFGHIAAMLAVREGPH